MIKLCDYGCGQEAKYPPSKGKPKWSCEPFWQQCPAKRKEKSIRMEELWEDPGSIYNSILYKENRSDIMRELWEDSNSMFNSDSWREKQSNIMKELRRDPDSIYNSTSYRNKLKLSIEQIKEKYKFFSDIEELRYNPDKPGEKEIQVHCKNHLCPNSKEKGGWFTPTKKQITDRKDYLVNEGEDKSNFYCSQHCKDICPLYGSYGADPYRNTELPYTQTEYNTFIKEVLERQIIRDKYNFCEKCYSTKDLHVHHEKPVKTHPLLALDPDNGIVLCRDCHYKYGHKTGTECSTANLANKVLPNCKLGGQKE